MAYSLVNSAGGNTGSASVTSYTLTYTPSNVGNVFFLVIGYDASVATAISSIKNQASTTVSYTEIGTGYINGSGYGQHVVVLFGVPTGTTSITVTLAASVGGGIGVYLQEYSGLAGSIDKSIVANVTSSSTSANNVSSGNVTPTGVAAAGGGILWSWAGSYSAFESCTAGTGFGHYAAVTEIIQGAVEDKRITTNSAVAATWTPPTSGNVYEVVAVVIDESGTAAPQLADDDMGCMFAILGGDDYAAGQADQTDMMLMSYDSGPVVATVAAKIRCPDDDVATQPTFYEGYEDPELWVLLDFAPVIPNAPPLVDDTWPHFDEYVEDWYGEHNPEDSDPLSSNSFTDATFYGDDAWDWSEDVGDDDLTDDGFNAQTLNAPITVEDAWPHFEEEVEDYDLTDDGAYASASIVPTSIPVEDSWPHFEEELGEDVDLTDDGFNVQNATVPATVLVVEDTWPHFEEEVEDTDLTDDGYSLATIVASSVVEDAWPHFEEEVEDYDLTDDGYNVQTPYLVPPPEDAWDHWAEEVEDWLGDHNQEDDDPLSVNYGVPVLNVEDAWDHWSEELGEDVDLTDDGFNVQNASVLGVAYLNIEDAWPHFEEELGEDTDLTDAGAYASPNVPTPPPEDPWDHWSEEVEDTDLTDDGFNVQTLSIQPPPPVEDAWDHWSEELGEDVDCTDDGAVRNPNIPTPPPEDPWEHFAEEVEDTDLTDDGGNVRNPNYVPPSPLLSVEDAWPHDDEVEDLWDGNTDPVGPNYVPTIGTKAAASVITVSQGLTSAVISQSSTIGVVTQAGTVIAVKQATETITVTQATTTITVKGS